MERGRVSIRVWGDYACFSRPEFKVERVSYPLITPSAARGVLEAIFWKPEIRYEIRRIGILKRGREAVILRNEISDRQGRTPLVIEEKRQQRSSLILKDVDYLIEADMLLRPHAISPLPKYLDQARRRITRGQYHHAPYLGCREFAANFAAPAGEQPEDLTFSVDTMLFDLAFVRRETRGELNFKVPNYEHQVSGYVEALFLNNARIEEGWLAIPASKYQELYSIEGRYV